RDADGVAAFLGVGEAALDLEAAAAVRNDGAVGAAGAGPAPVDGRAVVAHSFGTTEVDERGHGHGAGAGPFRAADIDALGAECGVGHVGGAGGAGICPTNVVNLNANRIRALFRVGVRADDVEAAAAVGLDRAGRAAGVAPADRGGEVARLPVGIGIRERGD